MWLSGVVGLLLQSAVGTPLLRATPATIEVGSEKGVALELELGDHATATAVRWGASVGTLTPQPGPQGSLHARYDPPPKGQPQIVFIWAEFELQGTAGRAWLGLPLSARAVLSVDTKPYATVAVEVADAHFGPVVAAATGQARVPVVIPPAVSTALVISKDRAGNTTQKSIELAPARYSQLAIRAWGEPTSSWADTRPLSVEVFAVDARGQPLAGAPTRLTASAGTLEPLPSLQPGVARWAFRAPETVSPGVAVLSAAVSGSQASLEVRLRPGPAAAQRSLPTLRAILSAPSFASVPELEKKTLAPAPSEVG